jgi:uncharacterized protein YueI
MDTDYPLTLIHPLPKKPSLQTHLITLYIHITIPYQAFRQYVQVEVSSVQ